MSPLMTCSKGSLVAVDSFTLNRLYRHTSTEQKPTGSSVAEPRPKNGGTVTCCHLLYIAIKCHGNAAIVSICSLSLRLFPCPQSFTNIILKLYNDVADDTVLHFSSSLLLSGLLTVAASGPPSSSSSLPVTSLTLMFHYEDTF